MGVNYRDFKPVTSEAVPFVYLASVCWSLQCLISALTQAGRRGLLFRFTCSIVLWGGRGTADKYHLRVWRTLSVFWPHWVCPHRGMCVFPVYTAQALSCFIGSQPWVAFQFSGTPQRRGLLWACVLCLPRPEQLGQPGAWQAHSPWVQCTLSPQRSQPQFPRAPVGCALCLFRGAGL